MIGVPSRSPSLPLKLPKADIPVEPMQVHMLSHLTLMRANPQRERRGRRADSTIWQIMRVDEVIPPGHPREPR